MTPTSDRRVLVVDADRSLAAAICAQLEREGYAVITAGRGDVALANFRRDQPSMILLDLMLPDTSGLDVCRAIRAESNVPIIIVSARDSEVDKVTALELGADDYLTKPFSMSELVSRIRALYRRSRNLTDNGSLKISCRPEASPWTSMVTRPS